MINVEKEIATKIALKNGLTVKKLGLRFDKVVVRLLGNLRTLVEEVSPEKRIVLMTITAPIKLAAKTEYELEQQIKSILSSDNGNDDLFMSVFQNKIRLRIINFSSNHVVKFVGLVHNPSTDAKLLLDLTTAWLYAE
ncbi:MAG: hypothetical protein JNM36_16660 [Chitinophagales bacterium]|jgi:hypothetical protein|nr:hypothetical protein [Chitinophagales bacterium]